ncbi:MAG: NlpC/P60 family protein [Beijerinckiaceae bacterium]|jgi:NlpC/P60 family putative phage cell wall peptidase|nr:NlpC/P60 family protein [Beijerinckiaceae bacterium]
MENRVCAGDGQRAKIIAEARRWIGTPYRHQASLLGVGCDCLGLVRGVWRELYGAEPEVPGPYTADWAEAGKNEQMADAAFRHFLPVTNGTIAGGDLLLFRWRNGLPAKHAAIAISSNRMIHAHDGAQVCEVTISARWSYRIAFVFSFPDQLADKRG